jgi:prolyl oligopeptidase
VFRYDVDSAELTTYFAPPGPYPEDFVVEETFVDSKDGTAKVPMRLVRKKEITPNGNRPVLIIGYGGFGVTMFPSFTPRNLVWLELGGVLAWTHLRGGGEYGKAWHDAGKLATKQNVFDDLISCAEWLVSSGWSRPSRIALNGGSNGGLLVGACLTQRPDLFGACVPEVGVLDMLRYDKWTSGAWWVGDYGSSDDPEQFKFLYAYSPLHRLTDATEYPPTMVMVGDHDDHVASGHSLKFAAKLQATQVGDAPTLLRVNFDTGHGSFRRDKEIASEADMLAFVHRALQMN